MIDRDACRGAGIHQRIAREWLNGHDLTDAICSNFGVRIPREETAGLMNRDNHVRGVAVERYEFTVGH